MADKSYQLVVRKGPRPGQLFPLTLDTVTVGRDPLSDIVLNDAEISRHHAQLQKTKDGYALKDLGSTNGTFVDGKRLSGETEDLAPGQVVMFGGNVTLIYQETSGADPLATMVGPMAALPPLEPPKEETPEPAFIAEPDPEPEPELEPEPEPDDFGTIIDPSPSFAARIEPEPEPEPKPFFTDPAPAAGDYLPQGELGSSYTGGIGASDSAVESAVPGVGMAAPPPMPAYTAEPVPPKSGGIGGLSRNATIAIIVGVVLLCCCCLLIFVFPMLLANFGYEVDFNMAIPALELAALHAEQFLL